MNSGAKSTLKFYADSPRMIPRGINPVCHRMRITIPTYCTAPKQARKRKSDGSEGRKSRKKRSIGEKDAEVQDSERCLETIEFDVDQNSRDVDTNSEQPLAKPSRKKTKSSKAKRPTGSRKTLAEDTDSVTIPDEGDSATKKKRLAQHILCLLYTSPSPRDGLLSRMPSSA